MGLISNLFRKIKIIIIPQQPIQVLDKEFNLPKIKRFSIEPSTFNSEPWMLWLLKEINLAVPIKVFIDIGANIGQTLLKIKAVNPNARYIGFEPNPSSANYTLELIKQNNIALAEISQVGISNHPDTLNLEFPNNDMFDSTASTVSGFRSRIYRKLEVNVDRLDSLINGFDLSRIDLIKVDIEGGELEAFEGMTTVLKKFKPILIFEVLPDYNREFTARTERQAKLSALLNDLDYTMYHIIDKSSVSLRVIQSIPSHSEVDLADYIAFPRGKNPKDYKLNIS